MRIPVLLDAVSVAARCVLRCKTIGYKESVCKISVALCTVNIFLFYSVSLCVLLCNKLRLSFFGFSYFPIGLGGGHDYARTKNPRKSPYQRINPKNVTSIYKSTAQGIMLRN